jgi:hypothetical protein
MHICHIDDSSDECHFEGAQRPRNFFPGKMKDPSPLPGSG